jgi:hypothetical protein
VEHEAWTLLMLKPAIGRDAEPVCSTLNLYLSGSYFDSPLPKRFLYQKLVCIFSRSEVSKWCIIILILNIIRWCVECAMIHDIMLPLHPFHSISVLSFCTKSYTSTTESVFLLVGRYSGCLVFSAIIPPSLKQQNHSETCLDYCHFSKSYFQQ